ncbi:hypothetical protein CEXT_137771 [Caerostris extrusa]|uniref:Uncharacterized protein n=1 Tax=Caerostris extrusa TaxID=172846 RepID=A0AAV4Y383_CAEEX|nr:hypothetical protein CEXT_137771 [Caerostris extrusa]
MPFQEISLHTRAKSLGSVAYSVLEYTEERVSPIHELQLRGWKKAAFDEHEVKERHKIEYFALEKEEMSDREGINIRLLREMYSQRLSRYVLY